MGVGVLIHKVFSHEAARVRSGVEWSVLTTDVLGRRFLSEGTVVVRAEQKWTDEERDSSDGMSY